MYIIFALIIFFVFQLLICMAEWIINKNIFVPPKTDPKVFETLNYENENIISKLDILYDDIYKIISFNQIIPKKKFTKYIIYSHGNSSTIYNNHLIMKKIAEMLNVCVISYDYPGYGLSEGIPSEESCRKNLSKIINFLIEKNQIEKKDIILIGSSLGTGVIVDYLSQNLDWVFPVVLISPYKSIFRIFFDIKLPLDKFKTIHKIERIKCPIKIIHGKNDDYIKITHGQYLYEKLNNKKLIPEWIDNVGHGNIMDLIDYNCLKEIIN